MKATVIIPHFKTLKMTAYSVFQFLEHQGRHEIEVIVIDNSYPDESILGLEPMRDQIKIIAPPDPTKTMSHGTALDLGAANASHDILITAESDSFPKDKRFYDSIERMVDEGYDAGGSLMKLSGGTYLHPAGAFYLKSVWKEASEYCKEYPYIYFPNMSMKEGFQCHLMVHDSYLHRFLIYPSQYIELASGYLPYSRKDAVGKMDKYSLIRGPFHNGMGASEESIKTYGLRGLEQDVLWENCKEPFVNRIGFEPGQFLTYWMLQKEKKVCNVPTGVVWLPDMVDQQQEYSLSDEGFFHAWGVSAYQDVDISNPVARRKRELPEKLYETLPEEYKIK